MDSKLRFIVELLKGKYKVKVDIASEIVESEIIQIVRCSKSNYLKVLHTHGEEYLSKLKIIKK